MDLLTFARNIADRVEGEASRAEASLPVCVIDAATAFLKHREEAFMLHTSVRAFEHGVSWASCAAIVLYTAYALSALNQLGGPA